jgi:hypothetical protein
MEKLALQRDRIFYLCNWQGEGESTEGRDTDPQERWEERQEVGVQLAALNSSA